MCRIREKDRSWRNNSMYETWAGCHKRPRYILLHSWCSVDRNPKRRVDAPKIQFGWCHHDSLAAMENAAYGTPARNVCLATTPSWLESIFIILSFPDAAMQSHTAWFDIHHWGANVYSSKGIGTPSTGSISSFITAAYIGCYIWIDAGNRCVKKCQNQTTTRLQYMNFLSRYERQNPCQIHRKMWKIECLTFCLL